MAERRTNRRKNTTVVPTVPSFKARIGFKNGYRLIVKYVANVGQYTIHGWRKDGLPKNFVEDNGSRSTLKVTLTHNGTTVKSRSFKGTIADALAVEINPFRSAAVPTARLWPSVKPTAALWSMARGEHTDTVKHHDRSAQGDHGVSRPYRQVDGFGNVWNTPAEDDDSTRAEAWRKGGR